MNITSLTRNSWLIKNGESMIGMILHLDTGFVFMNPKKKKRFNNLSEVEAIYGKLPFMEAEITIDSIKYPIDHKDAILIGIDPYPTYIIGNVVRAAGWWCVLNNQDVWTIVSCPKVKTLNKYSHEGPFITELDSRRAKLKLVYNGSDSESNNT